MALTPWPYRLGWFLIFGVPVLVSVVVQQDLHVGWLICYAVLLVLAAVELLASRRYEKLRAPRPAAPDLRRPDGQSPPP